MRWSNWANSDKEDLRPPFRKSKPGRNATAIKAEVYPSLCIALFRKEKIAVDSELLRKRRSRIP